MKNRATGQIDGKNGQLPIGDRVEITDFVIHLTSDGMGPKDLALDSRARVALFPHAGRRGRLIWEAAE